MKKFHIHTFGCQMNVHDSEKIAGILSGHGYEASSEVKDADMIVINTCSIRQKAEQKFLSELGRLKHFKDRNPNLKIAVAGCIAQLKGNDIFKRFPYVDFVFGPSNIDTLDRWINSRAQNTEHRTQIIDDRQHKTALQDNPEYHLKSIPSKREGQVRAWVSIMYGCDNFCSYCVVPYTRGREKSRPLDDVVNEVKRIAEQGFKEITLLGQNVNSYGNNLHKNIEFTDLLKAIHEIDGIERIRFVTSHPKDLSERLIAAMRDLPKMCEHMHLPLQAGSDKVLSLMNRGYTYKEYKGKVDALRASIPHIAITTDIITGFPGEADDDFKATLKALKEIEYDGIFAFKYSKRPDTSALSMPGHIEEKVKSHRLSQVLDLQSAITLRKNREVEGRTLEVLVEGQSDTDKDKLTGRTELCERAPSFPQSFEPALEVSNRGRE
ncbi:MAG: tRNA (N6-isopentenyl adenosine(37)-C2)-methylthiotransferase MiaB [Nitrospirae bacterium]|nr:tRNA (N6-isopentenyl adenosine(37)-C2)-methylthiotransferase MiaB [Nitrospirota bacterium]